MPGQYAHMAVINEFTLPGLRKLGLPKQAISALLEYSRYAAFGSTSPDFPFFDPLQKVWADNMHKKQTLTMVRTGIALVAAMHDEPGKQAKCLAWLLGYASHVATDVAMHPVVQLKSKGDSTIHRACEIAWDVHLADRLGIGEIGTANYFVGVNHCFPGGKLDPDIADLWEEMLESTYPDEESEPDFDVWYEAFKLVLEDIASHGRAIPFSRHLGGLGLVYPDKKDIDPQYIENLVVPGGGHQGVDEIFERAVRSTGQVWLDVANGVCEGASTYQLLNGEWNLDYGTDEAGNLVFWR